MSQLVPRLSLLVLVACGGGTLEPSGDGTDGSDSTPGPTDPTDSTAPIDTSPPSGPPTTLEALCEATGNTLRFTCTVTVDPPQPVHVRFAKTDGSGAERVHTSDLVAGTHTIPLYFLAVDAEYTWTAAAVAWPEAASVTGTVTTTAPPGEIPLGISVTGASSVPYVGTHSPCTSTAIAVIFDTATGELVWYHGVDLQGSFGFFDMIQFTEDHTVLGQTGNEIIEVDLTGTRLLELDENVDYPENLHHDLFKRDGHVYALFNNGPFSDPILDGFYVFDAASGARVATWTMWDFLAVPQDASGDWSHTNTIWVDDAGDIYLSSYGQNTVVKVDGDWTSPSFGEQLWALQGASQDGFGSDFVEDWSLVGGPDTFVHQHDVHRRPDGRMVMLDNINGRGLVVDLDEAAMTATFTEAFQVTTGGDECGPQGTASFSTAGNWFFACSGEDLYEFASGVPTPVWEGHADCGGGFESSVRWYPLEGW